MISFEQFVMSADVPIYQQIILYIKRGIAAGIIISGDELPSRRLLSALLGVNPNTVQKAYRQLEDEGLVQSHSGAKSFVVLRPETPAAVKKELLEGELRPMITAMIQSGISKSEALALLETLWAENEILSKQGGNGNE